MKEAKAKFVIRRALERAASLSLDQQAQAVVDALTLVLEAEEAEQSGAEPEAPVDLDIVKEPLPSKEPPELPVSPAVSPTTTPVEIAPAEVEETPQTASLILTPSQAKSKEAWDLSQKPVPIPRRRPIQRPGSEKKYWSYETLISYLERTTPPILKVVPDGTDVQIPLERNIVAGIGLDAVKLIYQLAGIEGSKPWTAGPGATPASLDAAQAPAMKIDLPVSQTFFLTDRDQPVEAMVQSLGKQAEKLYAPKSRNIVNAAPIRTGPLGFSTKDPHEDV